jgi:PTH1 family peptidyl-tRNA hydrolase
MKLIVGLGNPGTKYEHTRHNVGFDVIDCLSEMLGITLKSGRFNSLYGEALAGSEKVLLMKPLTYMNLSGEAVRPMMDWYRLDLADLLVIYDDLDLPVGQIRLRLKGSSGGHNGIKSLEQHLNTPLFKRIRIGIGRPHEGMTVIQHVLTSFTAEEKSRVEQAIEAAAKAARDWLTNPFEQVMNTYNSSV